MTHSLPLSKTTKILQGYLQLSFSIQINFLFANIESSYRGGFVKKRVTETYFFLLFFFVLEKASLSWWWKYI